MKKVIRAKVIHNTLLEKLQRLWSQKNTRDWSSLDRLLNLLELAAEKSDSINRVVFTAGCREYFEIIREVADENYNSRKN